MEQKTLPLAAGMARVWTAGEGDAETIVLLHGPWAGAEAYWFKVADELGRTHRIVAPELPGIGLPGTLLPTFGAYAAWLDGLPQRLDIANQLARRVGGLVDPEEIADAALGPLASPETRQALSRAESRPQALALLLMAPEFLRR